MNKYAPGGVPVTKGDVFSSFQGPKNQIEKDQINQSKYASIVGSLMYGMI